MRMCDVIREKEKKVKEYERDEMAVKTSQKPQLGKLQLS